MDIVPLLTAFGLGSIVTVFVQNLLSSRAVLEQRRFEEKKVAYLGLLDAYHDWLFGDSESGQDEFDRWETRCELVGSGPVIAAIRELTIVTNTKANNARAHQALKNAMRADLGIAVEEYV